MSQHFDRARTLDELDPPAWGEPQYDSYLVSTCHRLRRTPVTDFSVEDLRIMIGQDIGLRFLIPVALEVLERDPLAQGDMYPGDLLANVLRVGPEFWTQCPEHRTRLEVLLAGVELPVMLNEQVAQFREKSVVPSA
jgi:CDI immunity proteins